jgi:quinol-cytochrome oxidoreductase complex cytochrome b subunit
MIGARFRAWLDRPAPAREPFVRDVRRLAVFLFGVEVVTGALLALYYRPSPEGAYQSLAVLNNTVPFGWFVRSLHLAAGHALLAVTVLWVFRAYFARRFLGPQGGQRWTLICGFVLVTVAFLLTGESLPWNQHAYWSTVVTANLVAETPLVGGWLASVFRGGETVGGVTIVRLYAIHALLLPWIAFTMLVVAQRFRRRGSLS